MCYTTVLYVSRGRWDACAVFIRVDTSTAQHRATGRGGFLRLPPPAIDSTMTEPNKQQQQEDRQRSPTEPEIRTPATNLCKEGNHQGKQRRSRFGHRAFIVSLFTCSQVAGNRSTSEGSRKHLHDLSVVYVFSVYYPSSAQQSNKKENNEHFTIHPRFYVQRTSPESLLLVPVTNVVGTRGPSHTRWPRSKRPRQWRTTQGAGSRPGRARGGRSAGRCA